MNREEIEKRRGATQNIALGTKFILAHFGVVFSAYLRYIFPFVLIIPALLIWFFRTFGNNSTGVFWSDFNENTLNTVLFYIAVNTVSLLSAIVVIAAMKVYRDSDCQKVTNLALDLEIKRVFISQLKFIGYFILGLSISTGILYFIWSYNTGFGVLFLVLLTGGFLWMMTLYIMVLFAIGIEGDTISQGLARVRRYREDKVGSIFGVLLLGYMASLIVRWILAIPISVATIIFGFLSLDTIDVSMAENLSWFQIVSMIFSTVTSSIAFLFLYSFMLMKYFDIKERTDDIFIREKIAMIGVDRDSFFENEGEY